MEISDWRKKIDELDVEIVRLINQRAEAARAIGEIKKKTDLPVYEPRASRRSLTACGRRIQGRWPTPSCCMFMNGSST